jgi:hypothetical protein
MWAYDVSLLRTQLLAVEHVANVYVVASRKGGPRIELERWSNGVPVVHCYGHAGAGFQSSW